MDQRVDNSAKHWTAEVDNVMDGIGKVLNEQDEMVKETRSTLDRYISDELKRDIPTGLCKNELVTHHVLQCSHVNFIASVHVSVDVDCKGRFTI